MHLNVSKRFMFFYFPIHTLYQFTCTCVEDFEFASIWTPGLKVEPASVLVLDVDEEKINIDQNENVQLHSQ